MELMGTAHLYTLATLAMTFIGFAAIVMILRQTSGHKLSRLDVLIAHVHMEFGLMISAGALLPPLLMNWEVHPAIVWRVSGGLTAIPILVYALTYPARRRAASGEPTPFYVRVNNVMTLLIGLTLLAVATGAFHERSGPVFLSALTVFLIFRVGTFLQALSIIITKKSR
jgi:hypothetical protein